MRKSAIVLSLSLFLLLGFASDALAADWINWVQNRNLDQRGHASSPQIKNRHSSGYEADYVEMLDNNSTREGLQWMIFENGTGGDFDLKWKVVDYDYNPPLEIRSQTIPYSISTDNFHRLKVDWISGTTWRLYYDEPTYSYNLSWQDNSGNLGSTQIKVLSYAPPYYFFMGRQYNIWFNQLGYGWRRQDSGVVNLLSYDYSPKPGNPYTNFPIWYDGTRQYWDWEARLP